MKSTATLVSELQEYYYTHGALFYSYSLEAGKKKQRGVCSPMNTQFQELSL